MIELNQNEELIEGIIPEIPQHPELKRKFEPWHKPRKQYIREVQWSRNIENLIDRLDLLNRPFRYLSLPGNDFLDVRELQKICQKRKVELRFLGFDSSASKDAFADPAFADVMGLPHISRESMRIPDDFQRVSNKNSVAFKYVEEIGHFDVLNLDLCGSLATPSKNASYYNALFTLFQRQVERRSEPWLFFLTTRSSFKTTERTDIKQFMHCIEENCSHHPDFKELFWNLISIAECDGLLDEVYGQEMKEAFFNIFCVGVGKWLLQVLGSGLPKWDVKMLPSYQYKVHEAKDMVSFAFLLTRQSQPLQDFSGLANMSNSNMSFGSYGSQISEAESAKNLIKSTSNIGDLDSILMNSSELMNEYVEKTANLLRSAGYSDKDYFAQVHRWHPNVSVVQNM